MEFFDDVRQRIIRVIIVNWNSGRLLWDAVHALRQNVVPCRFVLEVVVVDNGSTDDSISRLIQEGANIDLRLIQLGSNRGFAYACNQGARGFEGEYLLFLNPDTRLDRDALSRALEVFDRDAKCEIGIVGISSIGENGAIQKTCARFPTARNFINDAFGLSALSQKIFPGLLQGVYSHSDSGIVDHVIGAFYLTRNRLFQDLNGFDERFFVYLEDLDYSRRAKQLGQSCYYLANASMYHKGGGVSEKVKDIRLFYSLRSRILYAFKHFSLFSAWIVLLTTLLIEPLPRLFRALLNRSSVEMTYTVKGYLMLYRDLPNIIANR